MMRIIDNLSEANHYTEIERLSVNADELIIISPFCFSDFKSFFDRMAAHSKLSSVTLITTLKEDETLNKIPAIQSFKRFAQEHGIQNLIFVNNKLHGKIYIFRHGKINLSAIISSANLTNSGLSKNHEWGCCFDDKTIIDNLYTNVMQPQYIHCLTDDMIKKIENRIKEWNIANPNHKPPKSAKIKINDIWISELHNVKIRESVKIFLKPVGTKENPVSERDFSNETKQYFAKKPKAIHKDDLLIAYAVGKKKIVSVFRVTSMRPTNTNAVRWSWYVEVENITPNYGKIWFNRDLNITAIKDQYLELNNDSSITNRGGVTYGTLSRGADKVCLNNDFGLHMLSIILDENK